jgi:hypothetical protein
MRSYSTLLLVFVCALLAVCVPVQENPASPAADPLASSPLDSRPLEFFEKRQFHSADYEASSPPPRVLLKPASANRHQGLVSRAILAEDSLQHGMSAKHHGDGHRDINWRVAKPKDKRKIVDAHAPLFESANDPNTNPDTQIAKSVDKNVDALDNLFSRDPKVVKPILSHTHSLINHNHHGDENKSETGHHGHTSELGKAALDELDEYCED